MNDGSKYPIKGAELAAISCHYLGSAMFGAGGCELTIASESNKGYPSSFSEYSSSFNLPKAKDSKFPSMNGGKEEFRLKQFEVYSVTVRFTINIIFRKNEKSEGVRQTFSFILKKKTFKSYLFF